MCDSAFEPRTAADVAADALALLEKLGIPAGAVLCLTVTPDTAEIRVRPEGVAHVYRSLAVDRYDKVHADGMKSVRLVTRTPKLKALAEITAWGKSS